MKTRIYTVKVESHSIETFIVRAHDEATAKDISEGLADGQNMSVSESTVLTSSEDDGQEVDNE